MGISIKDVDLRCKNNCKVCIYKCKSCGGGHCEQCSFGYKTVIERIKLAGSRNLKVFNDNGHKCEYLDLIAREENVVNLTKERTQSLLIFDGIKYRMDDCSSDETVSKIIAHTPCELVDHITDFIHVDNMDAMLLDAQQGETNWQSAYHFLRNIRTTGHDYYYRNGNGNIENITFKIVENVIDDIITDIKDGM